MLYLKDGNMTVGFNRELFGSVKGLLDGEDAVEGHYLRTISYSLR